MSTLRDHQSVGAGVCVGGGAGGWGLVGSCARVGGLWNGQGVVESAVCGCLLSPSLFGRVGVASAHA